ncbi:MAG TPA: hypothetical protein VK609_20105, partial [Mucilaginibacter sp.]|nr:hypothetical protein [Mucilaginibacter sp.]
HHYGFEKTYRVSRQQKVLGLFGENLKLARRRRRLTGLRGAERAGIDRGTLRKVEREDPSVSLGAYFNV